MVFICCLFAFNRNSVEANKQTKKPQPTNKKKKKRRGGMLNNLLLQAGFRRITF